MGKLSFLAGMAAGYVLGAKAGTRRYEQIQRTSTKVWNSPPVQKQVAHAKEVARTKAAPVVADMVADAARATASTLRQGKTIASEAISHDSSSGKHSGGASTAGAPSTRADTNGAEHEDAWSAATRPPTGTD
ncbi:protoporphyrinogen oxidase [uncultured Phycicoccus sp.]|uniref:protoporphyrinogen oxidase n=1 Tax=uncultured Phycicoccus sp. TaxID=661422 RepID=UPI002634D1C0|nr:protoporphyrinogen oxidase [uncultured Phycicoccus sp.]